jgi:FdhD protein
MIATTRSIARSIWRADKLTMDERDLPEETPVAFSYNGTSHAVMLATPRDLEDLAIGFSLSEQIISSVDQIEQMDVVEEDNGIDIRMWLVGPRAAALSERRRYLAGATGCGLCGIETLAEAARLPPAVPEGRHFAPDEVLRAVASLAPMQALNQKTAAAHAAAYWEPQRELLALREDVGRHNALDKLGGAMAREKIVASGGIVLLTSRVSVEMIQKAAVFGAPVIAAVSAPTALAVRTAETAGITLVAVARGDGFEIFTHDKRITTKASAHVV